MDTDEHRLGMRFLMNRCLERGQLCPREPDNWDSRTWLSALLSIAGSWTVSRSKRNKELSVNRSAGHRPGSSVFQLLKRAGAVPGAPVALTPKRVQNGNKPNVINFCICRAQRH